MKISLNSVAFAGLSACAISTAVPASAQVQGNIGIVDAPSALLGTTALQKALADVQTTYAAQFDQRRTKSGERQTLLQAIDTNGDKNVDDAELAAAKGSANLQKIEQLENEIAQLTNQIDAGYVFAVEQVYAQYAPSLQEVIAANQLQVVLSPDSVVFSQPEANVSAKVSEAINAKVQQVGIVPPADWQPTRRGVALFQQIQEILVTVQAIRQRQESAQQQQPAGNPAAEGTR